MPKGKKIEHGSFTLQFKNVRGKVEFRMDNKLLDIFGDGYLSTEEFHKLRGIVNHGFNHLNKYYGTPNQAGAPWTSEQLKAGSIVKMVGDVGGFTNDKMYVVKHITYIGDALFSNDNGIDHSLFQSGKRDNGDVLFEVVQY